MAACSGMARCAAGLAAASAMPLRAAAAAFPRYSCCRGDASDLQSLGRRRPADAAGGTRLLRLDDQRHKAAVLAADALLLGSQGGWVFRAAARRCSRAGAVPLCQAAPPPSDTCPPPPGTSCTRARLTTFSFHVQSWSTRRHSLIGSRPGPWGQPRCLTPRTCRSFFTASGKAADRWWFSSTKMHNVSAAAPGL